MIADIGLGFLSGIFLLGLGSNTDAVGLISCVLAILIPVTFACITMLVAEHDIRDETAELLRVAPISAAE